MRQLQRALIWQQVDSTGTEYCALWRTDDGWQFAGTVALALDGMPFDIRYVVESDAFWNTRSVRIELHKGETTAVLEATVDEQHRWWAAGQELAHLRGCIDVDLEITPATNTLPIRRLGLVVGESADLTAAWVRFPRLSIETAAQRYARLADYRYEFRSRDSAFVAELDVDELGLVTRYEGYWERVAAI